jgi:ferritin-like protein
MEAKEKAIELVEKYDETLTYLESKAKAKQCALIAVQEIINANPHSNPFTTEVYSTMLFWQEVKQEINNL